MGLDMFAYSTFEAITGSVDFEVKDATELHYWRKHPDLHGWMRLLYREKDGTNSEFNCVNVRLDAEDLGRLEADIREKRLPRTDGFFFGESDGSEIERRSRIRQQGARSAPRRSERLLYVVVVTRLAAKRSGSRWEPERAALRLRAAGRLALALRLRIALAATLVVLTLRIVQNGDGEDQQPEGCEAGSHRLQRGRMRV